MSACLSKVEENEVTQQAEMVEESDLTPDVEAVSEDAVTSGSSLPELTILQWNHFVPQYDKWFDPFAKAWGDSVEVEVTVEHVSLIDLPDTLTAAIEAGEGPVLVELIIAASSFVEGVHDLTDVNLQAQQMFGEQIETCKSNSYLPETNHYYGLCTGWVPDPGDYNIALWTEVGFPEGPATWADLLEGGARIKNELGVPMGIGLSPEMDSELANRAIIWSFGGSIQDENENVTINSPEVIEAVEFMAELYQETMTEEVFEWTAASNNQGLVGGELSYILNSISAYRSLQKIDSEAAANIGFVEALRGPSGAQHASAHLWSIYVIPTYVQGAQLEAAKAFLLHHTANYSQAVFNSELYNFPAFKSTVPELYEEGGWLEVDPFGSQPVDKLKLLKNVEEWAIYLGYPGPSNPAVAEVFNRHIITTMMGQVARGEKSAKEAVAEAESQIETIFEKWRAKGFVGGSK